MDAVTFLTSRHREMEKALAQLEGADDAERRTTLLREVVQELARHMAIEERVLFPAIRDELGPRDPETFGDDVLEALEEHHVLKVLLDELLDMDPADERFAAKAEVLSETVEHHHEEEEDELFPALREAWSEERLDSLGDELRTAEESAPTRPHPNLPDEGRFVEVSQRFAAAVDRVRDSARDLKDEVTGR